ncbi:MAG TPA: class I SAM-dependent methyltransferase [Candidatus Angelobacter sp.]|nr:class I SAM-dependent methyltransferase [Candidatus Angelobacter sp.]
MTPAPGTGSQPTPMLLFETIRGYHNSFVLKAAIELDLFTAIAQSGGTVQEIARACAASERGIRILCDYLTILGFLNKTDRSYSLTADSAMFLDGRSPACMGKAVNFLMHPDQFHNFEQLTDTIRTGKPAGSNHLAPEDPVWLDFARGMAPLMFPAAQAIAQYLQQALKSVPAPKVLDIAASHGIFGITLAQQNPRAQIYALDWANVLQVAQENARKAGIADRHHLIPGSAFDANIGTGYDAVLVTNFLHHFAPATNESLLKRFFAAMNPGAQLVILEFVPNEDRVSPPPAALFSMTMLANTDDGDAYTFAELSRMCANAGFLGMKVVALEGSPESLVVATRG